jgi:hypothetical protein
MSFDRKYLVWALSFAILGLCMGIYMASSQDHGQRVTHAHIMLAGFVVSLIYGVIHKLWLTQVSAGVATTQFILQQAGAVVMSIGLFLLYGQHVAPQQIEPFLAVSTFAVLLGAVLMLYMVIKSNKK